MDAHAAEFSSREQPRTRLNNFHSATGRLATMHMDGLPEAAKKPIPTRRPIPTTRETAGMTGAGILVKKAEWHYELKQQEQAIQNCSAAVAINPDLAAAYTLRAYSRYALGLYQEAIGDWTAVIRLKPASATAYYWRGSLQAQNGNLGLARPDFQKACDLGEKRACKYTE